MINLKSLVFENLKSLYLFYLIKIRRTSVNSKVIVFDSRPDYTDNCRALSDYLLENNYADKYDIYWIVGDAKKYRNSFPKDKVVFIENKGVARLKNLKLFVSAKFIFSTHVLPYYREKHNSKQHFILLNHGCGYKDRDLNHKKRKLDVPQFDKGLVAGPLYKKVFSYYWNSPENKILSIGFPRYDWLKKKDDKAKNMYEKIRGNNQKMIMWMPTFRVDKYGQRNDTNNLILFPLLHSQAEWKEIDEFCKSNHVLLVIKLHIYQKDYDIDWGSFTNIKQITNDEFEKNNVQMYSFLATTDALISDYSSVAVDYLLVDKPIAFALDDFNLYNSARGFVFDNPLDYMPGYHLYNIDDLKAFISDISSNKDVFSDKRHELNGKLIYNSINYCKELAIELGL